MIRQAVEKVKDDEFNEQAFTGGCKRTMKEIVDMMKAMKKAIKKDGYVMMVDAEGIQWSLDDMANVDAVQDSVFAMNQFGDDGEISLSCLHIA